MPVQTLSSSLAAHAQQLDLQDNGRARYTTSTGQTVELESHEAFYQELTKRNRGFISDEEQHRIRTSTFLVAGCGSIGGAVIEPLIRLGAERLVLAEPDPYDVANMNRQAARLQDVGRNKAECFAERMRDINPFASITVHPHGITPENAERLVGEATLIFDGVDVTTRGGIRAKMLLNRVAHAQRKPCIMGLDIAGVQLLGVNDYRDPRTAVLGGRVAVDQVESLTPMEFMARLTPTWALPLEMVDELPVMIRRERAGFPQLVYTAQMYGVLASRAAIDMLVNRPVRKYVCVDIHDLVRPLPTRLQVLAKRATGLYHLNKALKRYRQAAPGATAGEGPA